MVQRSDLSRTRFYSREPPGSFGATSQGRQRGPTQRPCRPHRSPARPQRLRVSQSQVRDLCVSRRPHTLRPPSRQHVLLPSGVWASRSRLRGLVTRAIWARRSRPRAPVTRAVWARRSRPCAPVTRAVCPASLPPPRLAMPTARWFRARAPPPLRSHLFPGLRGSLACRLQHILSKLTCLSPLPATFEFNQYLLGRHFSGPRG